MREIIALLEDAQKPIKTADPFAEEVREAADKIFAYCGGCDTETFTDKAILAMRNRLTVLAAREPKIYRLFTAPPSAIKALKAGSQLSSGSRYPFASWTTDISGVETFNLHVDDAWAGHDDDKGASNENPMWAACAVLLGRDMDMVSTICQRLNIPHEAEISMIRGRPCYFRGVFSIDETDSAPKLLKQVRSDLIGSRLVF